MKDDLPKDEKPSVVSDQSSDDNTPAKVSFHSLKDEEPEEEISKPVKPVEEEVSEAVDQKEPLLKKEIDKDPLDDEDSEEGDEDEADDEDEEPEEELRIKNQESREGIEEQEKPEEEKETDQPEPANPVDTPINRPTETTDIPITEPEQYYLQTVKVGEQPEWPRPKEDLSVFSQPLDDGLIQYWAYSKELNKSADDFPHAEEMAQKNQSENASIIIDQICDHLTPGSCLELVLAKNGHALAKTESNLDNLEANISSLLDLGRQNFGITAEHFMSTSRVLPEVEKRLDDLEEAEEKEAGDLKMEENNETPLYFNDRSAVVGENKRSKWAILIPVLILILIFVGVIYYREKLLSKVMNKINPPKQETVAATPIPSPTPTPAPSVERANFTVRILNGTPTTGAAGVLADKLKAKGWKIDRTGNATSSAILESYVRIKPGTTDDAVKVLLLDVEDYQGSSSSSILKSTDKADLEFVIGRK